MDSKPLIQSIKLLQGLAIGCILLANSLPAQADPARNNKIIQPQVTEDTSTLNILEDKAPALEKEGKYKEAAENWEHFIELAEKKLGPDHPDVALGLNNLASLYQDQGKYSKAEPLFIRSLAIYEKALGPNTFSLIAKD